MGLLAGIGEAQYDFRMGQYWMWKPHPLDPGKAQRVKVVGLATIVDEYHGGVERPYVRLLEEDGRASWWYCDRYSNLNLTLIMEEVDAHP
jgi:hypothetical protein